MPPTQYFVGIDLHKSVLQVCVLDAEGEIVCQERYRIGSREAGLEAVASLGRWNSARMAVEECRQRKKALHIRYFERVAGTENLQS